MSALAPSAVLIAQTRTAKALDIYVINVEGGNAQLYISPSGESVLIDTGNAGAAARAGSSSNRSHDRLVGVQRTITFAIEVADGDRRHTVVASDPVSPELEPLIALLRDLTKQRA